jgi:hypothetical protein
VKWLESLHQLQQSWRLSIGAAISVRGASGGICKLWNVILYREESIFEASHWLRVKLKNLPSGKIYPIINFYMPNNYWEKVECWDSLMGIKNYGIHQNCTIVVDFNTTMHVQEKRGSSIVKYPSREIMEAMVSSLYIFDVYPNKGKYTWSNHHSGKGHIVVGLDIFLINSPLLCLLVKVSSHIIPWGRSDHSPIPLSF